MTQHFAEGKFDIKLEPVSPADAVVGRMTISKIFHGALDASSGGEMLAISGEVKGSAGYVAMERVSGALNGKSGSFALQHRGVMDRGEPSLSVTVVPDTGTDELSGLRGDMVIEVANGQHHYRFTYSLPE